jgi:hypothetical protein
MFKEWKNGKCCVNKENTDLLASLMGYFYNASSEIAEDVIVLLILHE